ncbi:hypothetical protein [Deinococcus sonorensis]|uniref:Uncharacterized protein n=2 Tax=Deinococcus sonorensis TaxID=309891 RepID=A0AAU7U4G6_9DEIO
MNPLPFLPARVALSLLTATALAMGITASVQASARTASAAPPVVGTWNATFNDHGRLNPVLMLFHADGTLLMSGVNGDGTSLTLGQWRAAQNGAVAFEARILGAEKGRYVGQIHLRGSATPNGNRLIGTLGGEAVEPGGKVLFAWKGEAIKAFRVAPTAGQ